MYLLFGCGVYVCLYLYLKLKKGKCNSKKTLEGKTIVITGANTGIGFETALDLAKRNGRIILACRNAQKGEEAKNKIVQLTGNTSVVFRQVDVSLMSSVKSFVDVIRREENKVDILINNAGIVVQNKIMTEEGLELTFATNHFGPFLLSTLLLDLLRKSKGRIVNVGSAASVIGKVDCDNLRAEKGYSQLQYHNSKTATLLFTKELARRETDVTICCVHPGTVRTNVFRHMPLPVKILISTVFRVLTRSPSEGAQPVLFCALDDSIRTGGYYMDCRLCDHSLWVPKSAYDVGLAKKLWETTEKILAEC
ncbi:retinol dehydrogenase 11-like [Saccostrea echinata]|uniref:retinol dehydrogenase 11-like n=1 Tax=Saccostrea echinata TaxID=191078 RepID=UPI002A815590|nr:retinol dehydrogenase 11-like [Saccostrea echinata]